MENGRTIVYTRVSTANQSVDGQLSELRAYCERRGWAGVEEIIDEASGATQGRAGLDKLMALVRRGKVKAVLAFKLDRLARSLPHLAQMIGEFQATGTALVVPSQGVDTSDDNPVARLQLHILGAVAQFERDLIRERVNSGLKAARQRGVTLGRPGTNAKKHLPQVIELLRRGRCLQVIRRETGLARSSAYELIAEARSIIAAEAAHGSGAC